MKICVHDLAFNYNGTTVLKNVNCKIEKGDFVALVGANGSGKSTLIKCMNGILKGQKGAVLIDKNPLETIKPVDLAKKLAYVPQNDPGNQILTVFDMVLLGRKPYFGWKPRNNDLRITQNILESLNMEAIAMKDINKLSGGQQQIVTIARALAQEPDILLLDEPTANLDIKHQVEVLELLKTLSSNGITIIIALHDINMAVRYTNKLLMLKDGYIFAAGGKEIITDKNIEDLYNINIAIIRESGNIFIVPVGKKTINNNQ